MGCGGTTATCACTLCAVAFILGSILLYWLWYRTFSPSISIEMFEVPSLNKTSNRTSNTIDPTITFDLRLKNENLNEGVYYDTVNVTLYYYHANMSKFVPIGNISIPPFYQGFYRKKAHRVRSIQSYGVPWDIARMEVLNGGTTMFRVYVQARIRFKSLMFYCIPVKGRRRKMGLGANIPVNDQGIKSVKKGLRL